MSSKSVKYLEIAKDLDGKIKLDHFAFGRLPSERELAIQYKVNRITLRKALNLLEKKRIISRHGRLGTLVNNENDSVYGRTIVYLLVNREQLDTFHSKTLFWLENKAKEKGYKIVFSSISSTVDAKEFIGLYGDDKDIGGIVLSGLVTAAVAEKIKKLNVPIVLLGGLTYEDPVENNFHKIYLDSMAYSCQAVTSLIKRGHRNIALINGPSYKYYLDIYQGYMKAFDAAGLKYSEGLIARCASESFDEVLNTTKNLLIKQNPTAFFIANERMAEAAVRAVKNKKGNNIGPEDIITVGGDKKLADHLGYSLVYIDNREIAEKTIEIIDEAKGTNLREKVTRRLEYKIIDGGR